MTEPLLALHSHTDRVAFGARGDKTAADLLRDAAAVAAALPVPTAARSLLLVCVRRDPYACLAAALGAWSRGFRVAVPAADATREGFLALAQRPDVAAVVHDTASSAALPIAALLAGAAAQHSLTGLGFVAQAELWFLPSEQQSAAPAVRVLGAQLLCEAGLLGRGLGLPERCAYALGVQPQTRSAWACGLLWPLMCGGALLRDDPREPGWSARGWRDASAASVLISVPSQLRALCRTAPPARLPSCIVSLGAPLTAAAFDALARPGRRVLDVFAQRRLGSLGWRCEAAADFRALQGVSVRATSQEGLALVASPCAAAALEPSTVHAACSARAGEFAPSGARAQRAEWEERIAWLAGVRDAALLELSAGQGERRFGVAVSLDRAAPDVPDEPTLRARVAQQLPARSVVAWRTLASPLGQRTAVPSFCGGRPEFVRDGSGQHDRAGLLRLFGLDADETPLAFSLSIRREQPCAAGWIREVQVPSRYGYVAGHFPGYPILPGAAQLSEMVLPCVRCARPELGRLIRMARLKFQERIVPGDSIAVCLTFGTDAACIDFALRRGQSVCATGRLWFELTAAGATERPS